MTDLVPRTEGGTPSGLDFDTPGDRSRDFEKARRHTRHVRHLRIVLPIAFVSIIVIYVATILKTAGWGANLAQIALPHILPTDLTMRNPHYQGYNEDGSRYKIAAATAQPDFKNTNIITLNGITAELIDAKKLKTNMTAKHGVYDSNSNSLQLDGDINIVSQDGVKAQLTEATINTKSSVITSKKPVAITFPAGSVHSLEMTLKPKQQHVTFSGDVRANLNPPPKSAAKPEKKPENQMFVGSDTPVTITSQHLEIFYGDKRAIFKGEVIARQGTATLTTPQLETSYDTGTANAQGKLETNKTEDKSTPSLSATSGKLRRIIAQGPVVMTQGSLDRVTCQMADFDTLNETAILTGNVIMTSGPGQRARSDRVDLDQGRQRAVLTGNVVVTQDKNILKGRRLEIDQLQQEIRLTSPAGVGYGAGRITARFVQNAASVAAKRKSKSATASRKKQLGGFRADPTVPLDIIANQLVVRDRIKTAIFTGKVEAQQGAFKIEAMELRALYTGSAALGNISSTGRRASSPGATSLKSIKANKNVVITGSGGQRVKGDWAEFDVAKGQMVVGGNVEILQGGNVIHGTKLTIDTKTGRSIIETAPKNTIARPQGGGWVTTSGDKSGNSATPSNSGRPSAVFYLNDVTKKRRSKSKPRRSSASSAWEAQTAPPR